MGSQLPESRTRQTKFQSNPIVGNFPVGESSRESMRKRENLIDARKSRRDNAPDLTSRFLRASFNSMPSLTSTFPSWSQMKFRSGLLRSRKYGTEYRAEIDNEADASGLHKLHVR